MLAMSATKRRIERIPYRPLKRPRTHPCISARDKAAAPLHIDALPSEVLARVFHHVRPCDVGSARKVCRNWRCIIDNNAVDIWRAACYRLALFPANGTDGTQTVLAQCATRIMSEARLLQSQLNATDTRRGHERKHDRERKLIQLYSTHYHTWVVHICTECVPHSISPNELCPACTPPEQFEWIRYPKIDDWNARFVACPELSQSRPRPDTCYRLEDFVRMLDFDTTDHIVSFVHTIRQLGYVLK